MIVAKNERDKKLAEKRARVIIRRLFIQLAAVLNQAELKILADWMDAKAAGIETQPPLAVLEKLERHPELAGPIKRAERELLEVKRRWG